ncbi:Lig_chan-Glu_bd domain-containing protein [Meloidogyne graminicola]|uniref:Lig_chan-Glu_bd domain-containing protein n=1 Tax=Meloidogyne graminicola TaxID=189291 RepID=A0A8S9ZFW6_9BILA|nr:Lig_chan-Glu_bd domain-containing protein [Meloidogyne graminicola]
MRQLNLTEMANKILNVIVPRIDPPYLNAINLNNQCNDKTMLYGPGIAWEILCDMSNNLNLTYKIETVESEGWGKRFINNTWTGAFGRLNDGRAEILAGGSMMTFDRNKAFDFSDHIGYQSSSILIRVPVKENFVAQMLAYAFGWKIWLSIIGCFILFGLAYNCIQKQNFGIKTIKQSNTILSAHSFIFNKGKNIYSSNYLISSRILIGIVWICLIFLLSCFGANLVALFAHQASKLPFETFEELVRLVKSGEYKLVLDTKSTGRIEMIEAFTDDPEFSKILSNKNLVIFVDSLENGIQTVQQYKGNSAFIAPSGRLRVLASLECNVTTIPNRILTTYLKYSGSFGISNTSHRCSELRDDRLKRGIFGLIHFKGVFALLLVGLGISIFVLFFELYTKNRINEIKLIGNQNYSKIKKSEQKSEFLTQNI